MSLPYETAETCAKNAPPRLFHLMQLAHRALFRAADQVLHRELGISTAQQGALFVIAQNDPCHPTSIAKFLDMNKSAVTTLVVRLETAGLVTRSADPNDGRAQLIHLSDKGREVIRLSVPLTREANADLLAGFDKDEIAVIERFLGAVISRSARAASQSHTSSSPSHSQGVTP